MLFKNICYNIYNLLRILSWSRKYIKKCTGSVSLPTDKFNCEIYYLSAHVAVETFIQIKYKIHNNYPDEMQDNTFYFHSRISGIFQFQFVDKTVLEKGRKLNIPVGMKLIRKKARYNYRIPPSRNYWKQNGSRTQRQGQDNNELLLMQIKYTCHFKYVQVNFLRSRYFPYYSSEGLMPGPL